jgi:hypothetical protein
MENIKTIRSIEEYNEFVSGDGVRIIKYYLNNCPPCKLLAPTFERLAVLSPAAQVCLNDFKKADFPHITKAPLVEVWKNGSRFCSFAGTELSLAKMTAGIKNVVEGDESHE